jgi:hypothetical protein
VELTEKFLRTFVGEVKKFDPFAFALTSEARSAKKARGKTLCIDFALGSSPPQQIGEDPIIPTVSDMLSKCYNRFLYISTCMEVGDEMAVWTALKDGVFVTAHDLTRIHDGRLTASTGNKLFTNKASSDNGMIREKARERWKKEGKKGVFFREGGGLGDPPLQPYTNFTSNSGSYDLLPATNEPEDILAGSVLANRANRGTANRGRGIWSGSASRGIETGRGNFQRRGGSGPTPQFWVPDPQQRGRGSAQGERSTPRGGGRGGTQGQPWGDGPG